ncbi:Protein NDRG3 [Nymphon striatum]|nr:Protein NDRG3 [Nymphon striatum]
MIGSVFSNVVYILTIPFTSLDIQYVYPGIDQLSDMILPVLKHFNLKHIIGLGSGAGANILSRFALNYPEKVDALCLINCSSTAAGWSEWGYQKLNSMHLRNKGMTASTLEYLMWHHFGRVDEDRNHDLIQVYNHYFEHQVNTHNLASFINSYIRRTDLGLVREIDILKKKTSNMLKRRGKKLRAFLRETGEGDTLQGVTIVRPMQRRRVDAGSMGHINRDIDALLDDTVFFLEERFVKHIGGEPHSLFNIFDFKCWPKKNTSPQEFITYGDEEIGKLVDLFGPLLSEEEKDNAANQWLPLKNEIASNLNRTLSEAYESVLADNQNDSLTAILPIINIMLTISPSTAQCERGFSAMNGLKTQYRTSLNQNSLSHLMRVKVDGPSVKDFNPTDSLVTWINSGKSTKHLKGHKLSGKRNPRPGPAVLADTSSSDGSVENSDTECPVLVIAGSLSPHVDSTIDMNGKLDPSTSNLLKLSDCGMVLEEQPHKVCEALRLFLQGLGYVSNRRKSSTPAVGSAVPSLLSRKSNSRTNSVEDKYNGNIIDEKCDNNQASTIRNEVHIVENPIGHHTVVC